MTFLSHYSKTSELSLKRPTYETSTSSIGGLFLFLGPVIVPETTETVTAITHASTQLESTTSLSPSEVKSTKSTSLPPSEVKSTKSASLSPSEVKSTKSTSHKWTPLSYIFCQKNAEIAVSKALWFVHLLPMLVFRVTFSAGRRAGLLSRRA